MLTRHDLISRQIAEVEADRKAALNNEKGVFPHADKVRLLTTLGAVGETTATVLVAEIYHRTFLTRRQVASFVGLAPSPYKAVKSIAIGVSTKRAANWLAICWS